MIKKIVKFMPIPIGIFLGYATYNANGNIASALMSAGVITLALNEGRKRYIK